MKQRRWRTRFATARDRASDLTHASAYDSRRRMPLTEYRKKRRFEVTPEPKGKNPSTRGAKPRLAFVVQKHRATALHYDFRLEWDGVMLSWAVPKGPSYDPAVKRLAMQVEDHPIEYNSFEGIIPQGEYGGGTGMLWDRGAYEPVDVAGGEDPERVLRAALHRGRLTIRFHGERLHGVFSLVRSGRGDDAAKPQWLLIKRNDDDARPGSDITAEAVTS